MGTHIRKVFPCQKMLFRLNFAVGIEETKLSISVHKGVAKKNVFHKRYFGSIFFHANVTLLIPLLLLLTILRFKILIWLN